MAFPQTYQNGLLPLRMVPTQKNPTGINQLFAAAVVNQQFCRLLIHNPKTALQQGYLGGSFNLTQEEQALIVSIRAESLTDLARQVTKVLDQ